MKTRIRFWLIRKLVGKQTGVLMNSTVYGSVKIAPGFNAIIIGNNFVGHETGE